MGLQAAQVFGATSVGREPLTKLAPVSFGFHGPLMAFGLNVTDVSLVYKASAHI